MSDSTPLPPHLQHLPKVSTFEDVHEVFTSKAFGQAGHEESGDFLRGSLVDINGPEHLERLRIERPLFKRGTMLHYENTVLIPAIDRCLAECAVSDDGFAYVDLVPLGRKILTQIAATIIGLDGVETPERTDRLATFAGRLAQAARLKFAVGDHETLRQELLKDKHAFVEEFVDESRDRRAKLVAQHRNGDLDADQLPRDLVTLLLLHEDPRWDDDLLNREVILYLVGSTLTTAMAIPHAVSHIRKWASEHPADRERLHDVEFLRSAAYESMRLHVSSPIQIRRAFESVELRSGKRFDEGTDVAVAGAEANLDPGVYGEQVDEYNPHRAVNQPRVKLYGHTFAAGSHRCIGEPLAAGMPASKGENNATQGMVLRILSALFEREVELDANKASEKDPATTADFYVSFPVRFRSAAAGANAGTSVSRTSCPLRRMRNNSSDACRGE